MAYNTPGEVLTDIANSIRTLYASTSSIPFVDMPELIKGSIVEPIDLSNYDGTNWILPFIEHINFNGMSSISGLFSYIDCDANAPIHSLNLTNFPLSGLSSLYQLFMYSKFTSLDLTGWNTSEITSMEYMFEGATVSKMWVPSTFVATASSNKPFNITQGSLEIYTDATDATTQGWGTISSNVVIHYNSTYQDFLNA